MTDTIAEKLKLLPDSPGVYIMKDTRGKIIYVGKAIVLKNRVRQYFQSSRNQAPKVRAMVSHIADFETIMTANEVESLILEANLIKKHRPRYNIRLKDDKSYPYVKVTVQEEFPRVFITRRVLRDGARYFGPYTNVTALRDSLKLLKRLFPLRTCRIMPDRPCLEYHIKRCLAPCVEKVTEEDYRAMIHAVLLFLEGRTDDVERELEHRMDLAAEGYHFETAARLRDQLTAVRKAAERQNIVTGAGDQDAIGMARAAMGVCVQIFFIRGGKMIGREHFHLRGSEEESDADILRAFLEQYYNQATFVPREILLPHAIDGMGREIIERWLTERRGGGKVTLLTPQRGTKHDIVVMATDNAEKFLADEETRRSLADAETMGAVEELGRRLGLKNPPYRMECFDISHNQGQETVASMVVFEGGLPKKSDYRRFKIRSAEGKPDDFLSMRAFRRRSCPILLSSTEARGSSPPHSRSFGTRRDIKMFLSSVLPSSSNLSLRRETPNRSNCRAAAKRSISFSASATRRIALPSPSIESCAENATLSPSLIILSGSGQSGGKVCGTTSERLTRLRRLRSMNFSKPPE